MTDQMKLTGLEKDLENFYAAVPISDTFVKSLHFQLKCRTNQHPENVKRPLRLRPVWMVAFALFVILLAATLIIGPQKVYAEMRRLLGYIPGVGVVDTQTPIRVLSAPVEITRDGVTVSVTSATLTADRTQIDYRVFGVPRSAYPSSENETGCIELPYLLLPDGTQLTYTNDYPPVPAEVNRATFVIPCIANTLPGAAPEDWRFALEFMPAPSDLTVMPVFEIVPTQTSTPEPVSTEPLPTTPADDSIKITQYVEIDNGYILLGEFSPPEANDGFVQTTGLPVFTDANGMNVPINYPADINSFDIGVDGWVFEFNATGVTFPLTVTYQGVVISQPDPQARVEIPFEFGQNEQPQAWQPNLRFDLAGRSLTLTEVSSDSRGGYSFHLKTDQDVYGVRVQVKGYPPSGSGAGGGGLTNGDIFTSLTFTQPLSGSVTLVFSNLTLISEPLTWQTSWAPGVERADLPTTYELPEGTCGDNRTIQSAALLDGNLSGKVLVYQKLPDLDVWGLVLYGLDGTNKEVVKSNTGWGSLSADGQQLIYAVETGFEVLNLENGGTINQLVGTVGYNPVWSNDGTRFAFVRDGAAGVSIMDVRTGMVTSVSSLGWESVVGWLPDDSRLIISAMYSGGVARQIRSVDPFTGNYEELFLVEDASVKEMNGVLSPDGQWMAYRARDNNSVRLIKMDGSGSRLLLDSPAMGTSGIAWSENGWLGISLMNQDGINQQLLLLKPQSCELYRLPEINANLLGLFVD